MSKIVILVGLSGSGKTTYADNYCRSHQNAVHISFDAIHKELFGDESVQENPKMVLAIMQCRTVDVLKEGKTVLYDATNITENARNSILSAVASEVPNHVIRTAIVFKTPISQCISQDESRERTVGKNVIFRQKRNFSWVKPEEGFDEIYLFKNGKEIGIYPKN